MEAIKGIYHPDKVDAKNFIANFTIRLKEFAGIIDSLKKQNKKPLQHFLITGKRGMGKSTLLRRIFLETEKEPLSDKLITVRLGSEQYKLSRLYKLWEEVIKHISLSAPELNSKRQILAEEKYYEKNVIQIIIDYLNEQNKTLLLLIDNFDQFVDKLSVNEQHALREVLMQYPVQIIGNAVFYDEHFSSYQKPFFDFFKPIRLKNLDKKEAEDFIKQLAVNEGVTDFEEIFSKQQGKIQTLRILSGGVPRTLVILLSILLKKNIGDAVDYLNEMLEQVTPLYQDRMKALSAQQQEIMHYLAIHWDRTPVKELAEEMRIPSKSISAQLAQLESIGYINKINTSGRNLFYEIDERFFNIWLLMSEASAHDANRVLWLTRWMDMFYDNKELEDYASWCNTTLKQAKPANRFLIMQALSESKKLPYKIKDNLVAETASDLSLDLPQVNDWEQAYGQRKNTEGQILYKKVNDAIEKKNYNEAITKLNTLKEIDEFNALGILGYVYNLKKDYSNAEKYYLLAVEKGNVVAMYNLGIFYENIKKDYDNAEKYYLKAVEKGDVNAMYNLGIFYVNIKKDYDNAEKYYLMAVKEGDVIAMANLGVFYHKIKKDYSNAEKYFLMAVEKDNDVAKNQLASLYFSNKNKKEVAFKIIGGIKEAESDSVFLASKIVILLWNEKIKEAQKVLEVLLNKFLKDDTAAPAISNSLSYFLVFKQKHFLYKLFSENVQSLKDRFKPVYFALLNEMKTELPNEYLKMPEELEEPVKDLLNFIQSERERLEIL